MVLFNHATREMTAKIVYYGPGLCGKTTNLMVIFDKLDPKSKGKMLSLATKTDRTLFFDLLPVDIGKVGPFNLKIQLYTVPGQVFYNETRKLVLRGADSVVFVADSQPAMIEANRESFANLLENLEENQIDPNDTPIVIQFNKRDLPGVLSVEKLQESLSFEGYPYTEAAAIKGEGVMETFKLISKLTAKHLFARLKGGKSEPLTKKTPVAAKVEVKEQPQSEMLDNEPLAAPPNPFADSLGAQDNPFPAGEAAVEADYEAAEEVSLEQLLAEGRSRPTFSGTVPVPLEEIEELGAEELMHAEEVEEPEPIEEVVETIEEVIPVTDNRIAELEAQVASLENKLQSRDSALQDILRDLDELRQRIAQLS
ncbi:MAG TPA: GTPase domain-containing protein [Thermoanaerobaculia bacterium]|jgi:signal recognition particle receptor subunit beta|nr:GTPase domain-containing protein [Thermoanaerobaculia bacterium]